MTNFGELPDRIDLLDEIERRQNEVLRQLDELDGQILGVLKQYTRREKPENPS